MLTLENEIRQMAQGCTQYSYENPNKKMINYDLLITKVYQAVSTTVFIL